MRKPFTRLISFTKDEAEAIRYGRKTQFRIPMKPQPSPETDLPLNFGRYFPAKTDKKTGDVYAGKETFGAWSYDKDWPSPKGWCFDLLLCKKHDLLLEIRSVRVQRVQEISEADSISEGVKLYWMTRFEGQWESSFAYAWQIKHHKDGLGWNANPFVWVYEFRMITK